MALSGDFAGLGQLERNLRRLAEVPARVATKAAEKIHDLIQEEYDAGQDAYGNAWASLADATIAKGRSAPPLDDTGDMRGSTDVSPMAGAGIAITFGTGYASFHMTGTKWMPARHVLPVNTFPATWRAALEQAQAEAIDDVMGGK